MTLEEELAKRKSFLEMRERFEEARCTGITLPNEVRLSHYQAVMGIIANLMPLFASDAPSSGAWPLVPSIGQGFARDGSGP